MVVTMTTTMMKKVMVYLRTGHVCTLATSGGSLLTLRILKLQRCI